MTNTANDRELSFKELDSRLFDVASEAVETREVASDESDPRSPQADRILKLVQDIGVELIRDTARTPYALVPQSNGKRAVYSLRSPMFTSLIAREFHRRYKRSPNAPAVSSARLVLEGQAVHGERCEEIALRVAEGNGAIDIDLGDDDLRMVHITRDGWSVEPHVSRLFRRSPGMLALPEPLRGGDLSELRRFLRVDDNGFALVLCFLVCALRGYGPYPILQIGGEHGSAKTTSARILRALIDPNRVDIRGQISDTRDLIIAANNGHLLIFDNLSSIAAKVSDDLCRLSTGSGFTTRQLFTDQEEVIFVVQRPVILTGIPDLASRADLSDRCLSVRQITIAERERQTERDLWERFYALQPRLLGALFDALVVGLRRCKEVEAASTWRMRMADAYVWSLSAAPALGLTSERLKAAWLNTRDEANALTLESSPIFEPLLAVVEPVIAQGESWCGTATELREELEKHVSEAMRKRRDWPTNPRTIADEVRRIAPALRSIGIDHLEPPRRANKRLHQFIANPRVDDAGRSVTSVTTVTNGEIEGFPNDAGTRRVTEERHADAGCVTQTRPFDAQNGARDANDAGGKALYTGWDSHSPVVEEEL